MPNGNDILSKPLKDVREEEFFEFVKSKAGSLLDRLLEDVFSSIGLKRSDFFKDKNAFIYNFHLVCPKVKVKKQKFLDDFLKFSLAKLKELYATIEDMSLREALESSGYIHNDSLNVNTFLSTPLSFITSITSKDSVEISVNGERYEGITGESGINDHALREIKGSLDSLVSLVNKGYVEIDERTFSRKLSEYAKYLSWAFGGEVTLTVNLKGRKIEATGEFDESKDTIYRLLDIAVKTTVDYTKVPLSTYGLFLSELAEKTKENSLKGLDLFFRSVFGAGLTRKELESLVKVVARAYLHRCGLIEQDEMVKLEKKLDEYTIDKRIIVKPGKVDVEVNDDEMTIYVTSIPEKEISVSYRNGKFEAKIPSWIHDKYKREIERETKEANNFQVDLKTALGYTEKDEELKKKIEELQKKLCKDDFKEVISSEEFRRYVSVKVTGSRLKEKLKELKEGALEYALKEVAYASFDWLRKRKEEIDKIKKEAFSIENLYFTV